MRTFLAVTFLCVAILSVAGGTRLQVSTHDLEFTLGGQSGFSAFLDGTLNETATVDVVVIEGANVVNLEGVPFEINGTQAVWVNLTAVRAGHVTITLNTSLSYIDASGAFVRISVLKHRWLNVLSAVFGWIYFIAWSVSFYPQIFLNWKRRSVVGLSFDFISLNLTGFLAYSFFNLGMYFSPTVQTEYLAKHPTGVIPVETNDIVFGLHASLATFITVLQCCFYEKQDQRVSLPAKLLLVIIWVGAAIFGIVTVAGGNPNHPWLTFLYFFSYSKLTITLIKYIPQAYLNIKRQSTVGWSIGNILLDFTGGSLSLLQMFMIAHNYDDWSSLFGNFTKFGLGFISIAFDILFIVQHYVLYRHATGWSVSQGNADDKT